MSSFSALDARYALPRDMDRNSYCRSCPEENLHRKAVKMITGSNPAGRCITIHLCDDPVVCAFIDELMVDTSCGYSAAGGLPSRSTTGMIDPSIPLMLLSRSGSLAETTALILEKSGFQTLPDGDKALIDLIDLDNATSLPRRILIRVLLKAIGESLVVLGGAERLIFFSTESRYLAFVSDMLKYLNWLGVHPHPSPVQRGDFWTFTREDSPLKVFFTI